MVWSRPDQLSAAIAPLHKTRRRPCGLQRPIALRFRDGVTAPLGDAASSDVGNSAGSKRRSQFGGQRARWSLLDKQRLRYAREKKYAENKDGYSSGDDLGKNAKQRGQRRR